MKLSILIDPSVMVYIYNSLYFIHLTYIQLCISYSRRSPDLNVPGFLLRVVQKGLANKRIEIQ